MLYHLSVFNPWIPYTWKLSALTRVNVLLCARLFFWHISSFGFPCPLVSSSVSLFPYVLLHICFLHFLSRAIYALCSYYSLYCSLLTDVGSKNRCHNCTIDSKMMEYVLITLKSYSSDLHTNESQMLGTMAVLFE